MAVTIRLKRGTKATMPTLREGELGFTTDEGLVYIGTKNGNKEIGAVDAYDIFVANQVSQWETYQGSMNSTWNTFQTNMSSAWIDYETALSTDWLTFHQLMEDRYAELVDQWNEYQITEGMVNITRLRDLINNADLFDTNQKMSADYLKDGTANKVFTAAEKTKLAGLSAGSMVEDSTINGNILVEGQEVVVYTHPATHSADIITDGTNNKAYTAAEKTKLAGIAAGATNYSHPTGDGNLHVIATGTGNNGKVLTAGSTAGSLSWTALPTSLPANGGNADTVDNKHAADFVAGNTTGLRLTIGTAAPSSPVDGKELWVDTTNKVIKLYLGTSWITLGAAYSA